MQKQRAFTKEGAVWRAGAGFQRPGAEGTVPSGAAEKSAAELCPVPGSVLPDFLETRSDVIGFPGLRAPSWGVETRTSLGACPGGDR